MNLFLKIVCAVLFPFINAWNNWSEKQQRTYEQYHSEDAQMWRRIRLNQKFMLEEIAENARKAKWREKQERKAVSALANQVGVHEGYVRP